MRANFQLCLSATKTFLLICILASQANSRAMLALSPPTDQMYVGVTTINALNQSSISTNSYAITNDLPVQYDERLTLMYFCKTGVVELLRPDNKGIMARFELRDQAGKAVAKTVEGNAWGAELKYFPAQPGMSQFDKMSLYSAGLGPDITNYTLHGWPTGPIIPPVNELFVIKSSGTYYLTMEVHLMKQHMQTNGWTWDHIGIPAFTFTVVKP